MKAIIITIGGLLGLLAFQNAAASPIKKVNIPDIAGYRTLVMDPHTHSVFSDGRVLPRVRVSEAIEEGLDVLAITEHIEDYCRKVPETKYVDLNTSYNQAKEAAEGTDLIVIRGGEISRDMPPGHLNALFLKDVNPLDTEHTPEGVLKAIELAAKQGAYIIWNHPGWDYHQPDTTLWFDYHTMLVEKGWLHGIEIANYTDGCYPEALAWYSRRNLAPMAGSDTHGPTFYEFDVVNSHRPLTLVFAKERSEEGVREALFDRRTLAYDGNFLYGQERWLKAVFEASVKQGQHYRIDNHHVGMVLTNDSDIDFVMVRKTVSNGANTHKVVTVKANSTTVVEISELYWYPEKITMTFECTNLLYDRNRYAEVSITAVMPPK